MVKRKIHLRHTLRDLNREYTEKYKSATMCYKFNLKENVTSNSKEVTCEKCLKALKKEERASSHN